MLLWVFVDLCCDWDILLLVGVRNPWRVKKNNFAGFLVFLWRGFSLLPWVNEKRIDG